MPPAGEATVRHTHGTPPLNSAALPASAADVLEADKGLGSFSAFSEAIAARVDPILMTTGVRDLLDERQQD
jgi:hypothetical protein